MLLSVPVFGYMLRILRVFVALGTDHALCIRHIVICGLPGSTLFSHSIS